MQKTTHFDMILIHSFYRVRYFVIHYTFPFITICSELHEEYVVKYFVLQISSVVPSTFFEDGAKYGLSITGNYRKPNVIRILYK